MVSESIEESEALSDVEETFTATTVGTDMLETQLLKWIGADKAVTTRVENSQFDSFPAKNPGPWRFLEV